MWPCSPYYAQFPFLDNAETTNWNVTAVVRHVGSVQVRFTSMYRKRGKRNQSLPGNSRKPRKEPVYAIRDVEWNVLKANPQSIEILRIPSHVPIKG
jgi:hypothetical protein